MAVCVCVGSFFACAVGTHLVHGAGDGVDSPCAATVDRAGAGRERGGWVGGQAGIRLVDGEDEDRFWSTMCN